MKNVALYIKQSSTKTYRLLKSIFKLPNLTTIARELEVRVKSSKALKLERNPQKKETVWY